MKRVPMQMTFDNDSIVAKLCQSYRVYVAIIAKDGFGYYDMVTFHEFVGDNFNKVRGGTPTRAEREKLIL